jgi:very-short-patch-repair endonuclease
MSQSQTPPLVSLLAAGQAGVVSRAQALASGMSLGLIRSHLSRNAWQHLQRGSYATFSGPPPRLAIIWGVLLAAGEGAALSHYSAAEFIGLLDRPRPTVYVTVPARRRVQPLRGAIVHVSVHADARRHPTRMPPLTRIEDTVLDLTDLSTTADDAVGWLSSACGRRLTTPQRLADAIVMRTRLRWRTQLGAALSHIDDGVQSLLEYRYRVDVELAHGLPTGARQMRRARSGSAIYEDIHYEGCAVSVELDGRVAHPEQMQFRDLKRDNIAAIRGDAVLHFGWTDVTTQPCAVALQVETTLRQRGWSNTCGSCGPRCIVMKI